MRFRPSLLLLAGAAGLSAVANAVSQPPEQKSRFGVSIQDDMAAADRAAASRKRQLDLQEQAARAAGQRLKAAVPPPAAVAATAPTAEEKTDEQRYEDLARIYQAMKPKAAAAVFEQLTLDVQVKVAERMRERSTALIMAAMTPKAAATLTMAMAKRQTSYTVLPAAASLQSRRQAR